MAAPGQTPVSDSGVAELQRVLKAYVQITGYAPADPGTVDGIVGIKTAMAVIAMLPRVPGLPDEVRALAPVISLMLATEDGRSQAFGIIKRNAGTISKGIIAMEAYRVGTSSPTAPPPGTTPTSTSVKANTLWHPGANINAVTSGQVAPAITTAGGAIPTNPALAIWFFDGFHFFGFKNASVYRLAVPRGGLNGFADYVEVAPSASQPNFGTQVSRTAFMAAVGQWWWTVPGMIAIGAALAGGGYAAYRGARALL